MDDLQNKIINTFYKMLEKKNYDQISIKEISNQVGITRTYFYEFFESKADLAKTSTYCIYSGRNAVKAIAKEMGNIYFKAS